MSKEKSEYWKWKNTIIDFDTISNEKDEYCDYITKKDIVFKFLGTPDNKVHEWYNGGFSSEYNTALRYARQLNLVEDYIDYEDKIYNLQQRIDKAIEYIEKEYYKEHDRPLENLCLKNCTYEPSLVVLGILKGEN